MTVTVLKTDIVTQNYMRYCYYCDQAVECDTEVQCLACWEQKEAETEPRDLDLTLHYLREHYE
ncbi:hypothetical protein DNH61_12970 [Paenibacillus sambharensis]|uniref:Uncharacterized protein n=1 Tax=Paenibacillus sambharensis TaxID=1803190 RepID=A0A2W1LBD8_9BACL|nr:hypothetical protein DNH61_12970 [Paenibacillus sambharensis]